MKRVHIISIGGAIMHNIAIQLSRKGYRVTGSDDILFDPSKTRLAESGLLPDEMGWNPERITKDIDFVIAGMHAKKDNPELLKAVELGLKVYSFPSFIRNQSEGQIRIVVAGSHGKTTTASMIYHIMSKLGMSADHLIGAKMEGLEDVVTFDGHPYFILEGDEYPSSALDARPKFLHYDPDFLIITGIAWDHMNVFPTYAEYFDSFRELMNSVRPECLVIYNSRDPEVMRLIYTTQPQKSIPYSSIPYRVENKVFIAESNHPLKIIGQHNIENLAAAVTLLEAVGLNRNEILEAAETFNGAARRLQLLQHSPYGNAYLDFAHAPSKVRASTEAVYSMDPDKSLTAVLELHTFSSLNRDFLPQYKGTLDHADTAVVMFDPEIIKNKNMSPLSEETIRSSFGREDVMIIRSASELEELLNTLYPDRKETGMNLLLMSSGSFGGLDVKKKLEALWNK